MSGTLNFDEFEQIDQSVYLSSNSAFCWTFQKSWVKKIQKLEQKTYTKKLKNKKQLIFIISDSLKKLDYMKKETFIDRYIEIVNRLR